MQKYKTESKEVIRGRALSVVAIVPAYNEAGTVGLVVEVLKRMPQIADVVVVDDGSRDKTKATAEASGARVVSLRSNGGKGQALSKGVDSTISEIIVFVDADLLNLEPSHIEKILNPILEGEYDMVTGVVDRGEFLNRIMESINDPFAGVRALRRDIWEAMPDEFKDGYLVDSGIHVTATRADKRIKNVVLPNLRQVTKTTKYGLSKGILLYSKMWSEVALKALMFFWFKNKA